MKLIKIKNCSFREDLFQCCSYNHDTHTLSIYFINDSVPLKVYDISYDEVEKVGLL